jgi:hypothetical protein
MTVGTYIATFTHAERQMKALGRQILLPAARSLLRD